MGSILGDRAESLRGDIDRYVLIKLWYIDALLLQVGLTTSLAARIKLRRTGAVTVAAADLGLLAGDITLLSHKSQHPTTLLVTCNAGLISEADARRMMGTSTAYGY